jgi:type VI secretion system secreted protein VgrG
MAQRTQEYREIAVGSSLGDDVLLFESMTANERLGRLFRYDLTLLSEDPEINFDDVVGQNMTLRVELPNEETRYFNGYVSRFVQTPSELRLARYQATLVPWLWFLTRTSDCQIFQEMTAPEIIKQIFQDAGFTDFEDSLSGSYRQWEYCVQYRETTFNFVSRLMEQEGIYYFFRHENGKHFLVLADSINAHEPFPGYEQITYRPDVPKVNLEYISSWQAQKTVQPGAYAHTDFDFELPKKDLLARSVISRQHEASEFEIFDYPGEYKETGDGDTYAKVRIEELHASHEIVSGQSNARGIRPGYLFELTDHPRGDQGREYLVTETTYNVSTDAYYSTGRAGPETTYECRFQAIDSSQQYRPLRRTSKPVIQGPQTAIVVGKSGEEIWTDKHGRVKVQFHWDRYGKADENSSCWIRVAHAWAGKKWGSIYLPRIGQEVIVEFLEGDPDRPIITGRVYNGDSTPPYELPGNATMSTLKSLSSKGGGGFNEIRFEDKKDEEQVFIHAQKNLDIRVLNDRFETIINNRHLQVEVDKHEHVKNNRHEVVDADHVEEIGKDRHLNVKGKQAVEVTGSNSLTVKGDVIEVFKANHSEEVTQNLYLKAMGVVIEAMQGITLKVGGNSVVVDSAGVTVKGSMVTIDGSMTKINSGPGSPPASGQAGSAVAPAAVTQAEEADKADPGEMAEIKAEQLQKKAGKYGSVKVKPFKPPEEEEKSWIEIELVDEEDTPVPGEYYEITLPDGETVASGTLDDKGFARVDGIDPGTCKITFPELDKEAWEPA